METEKLSPRRHLQKRSKKTVAEDIFDKEFLKEIEKQDPKVFKEFCELVLKQGISSIVNTVKTHNPIPDPISIKTTSPPPETYQSSSRRSIKLPKLQSQEDNSDRVLPFAPSSKSLNSILQTRLSPVLQPLQSLSNFVSQAGFRSRVGTVQGKPKLHNEDSVIIKQNLQNTRGQYLFTVCDGHGREGHAIAEFVKEKFVSSVEMIFPSDPQPEKIKKSLLQAYENLGNSLVSSKIDSVFSGCTLVSVVISGANLVCANLGDCKAVIGKGGNKWQMIPLTIEHTLENKKELERMLEKNARIELELDRNYIKPVEVQKAYMGKQSVPGLEITRSLGDKCGKCIGMLSTPDVISYQLNTEDKFLIIGSSGFWKFVTEIEAYKIVRSIWDKNQIEESCEELIKYANQRWKEECRDKEDITVIVVYLGTCN